MLTAMIDSENNKSSITASLEELSERIYFLQLYFFTYNSCRKLVFFLDNSLLAVITTLYSQSLYLFL